MLDKIIYPWNKSKDGFAFEEENDEQEVSDDEECNECEDDDGGSDASSLGKRMVTLRLSKSVL